MVVICLIRHGETDWNSQKRLQGRENIELNDTGRAQALRCSSYLKRFSWDAIISSTLSRALETAKIIGENIGIKSINEMEEFIERDFGMAAGLTYHEKEMRFPEGDIPNQEDKKAMTNRVMRALEEVTRLYDGKKIIVVTHGAVISSILSIVTDNETCKPGTALKNACLNLIHYNNGNWKLLIYNSTVDELEDNIQA